MVTIGSTLVIVVYFEDITAWSARSFLVTRPRMNRLGEKHQLPGCVGYQEENNDHQVGPDGYGVSHP